MKARYNGLAMWPFSWLSGRKKKLKITREASFAARPVRNPLVEWDEESTADEMTLTVPRRKSLAINLVAWALGVPHERKLVLDEMGSFVWRRCDGEHSVGDMVQALTRKYKLSQREATVSLTTYLQTLGKRNLVAFAVEKALVEGNAPDEKEAHRQAAKGERKRRREKRVGAREEHGDRRG